MEFKYRISWSKLEFVNSREQIEHPIVREALRLLNIDEPLEITTFSDVPASTGLGSSSSFAVGLLHALHALKGQYVTKNQLAEEAAKIEIELLQRPIGKQDHYAASYGNFNIISFLPTGQTLIHPVFYQREVTEKLNKNLLLFYTQQKRDAAEVLHAQRKKTASKFENLKKMKELVPPLRDAILSNDLDVFGNLLHQNWLLKRDITEEISNSFIDKLYSTALDAGATGGKLLGAGGGGFLLLYVKPDQQARVREALSGVYEMKFSFDTAGSRIIYYTRDDD